MMNADHALKILRENADRLRERGIRHAALFGSVARGEAGPQSDIDILIELDPELRLDIFAYAGLKRFVAELFHGPVDVINRNALKPHIRGSASLDSIEAF